MSKKKRSAAEGALASTETGLRFVPTRILRGQVPGEEVLFLSKLGLMVFALHWEEAYFRMDFLFVLLPFSHLPETWQLWAWLPAVLAMPINAWWLDRFIARESGADFLARRPVLWARRVLCSLPVLGLMAIPLWQWLRSARPHWVFERHRDPRLILSPAQIAGVAPAPRIRLLLSPIPFFFLWCIAANFFWLKAAIASLVTWRQPAVDSLVLTSSASLRITGLALELAYIHQWNSRRGLHRSRAAAQSLMAFSWLVPLPLAYLVNVFVENFAERTGKVLLAGSRRAGPAAAPPGRNEFAVSPRLGLERSRASSFEPESAARLRRWMRLKMALLFFEVPLVMLLFSRAQAAPPVVAFPVALVFLWLIAAATLGSLWGAAGLLMQFSRAAGAAKGLEWEKGNWRSFFGSFVFLGGFLIGAGFLRDAQRAAFLLEQIGAFGSLLAPLIALYGMFRQLRPQAGRPAAHSAPLSWLLFFIFLWASGVMIRKGDPGVLMSIMTFAILFAVFSIRALRCTPWLLWPFRWEDLRRPALPLKLRLHLLALVLLGAAPFTGSLVSFASVGRRGLERAFAEHWSRVPQEGEKIVAR